MIWLVGAGPGDAGLLTLRGLEVLKRADVVIYDHLVGEAIRAMIPDSAEVIDAGKSSGNHTLSQREIESLMIDRACSGKNVVRLKGGDPFVFGRGGEEAEAIIAAGLAFEVVPGVSSALAVPAYAGIPATHRDYCSGVSIFTAHDKNNLLPDFEDSTQIFLMGVANARELQEKLLLTLPPETPCAVIQNGTTARQRTFRTKLSALAKCIDDNAITPPAVIVAGKTAGLSLSRRDSMPLNGRRILITRPAGRSEELSAKLRDLGAEVIHLPTIATHTLHGSLDGVRLTGYDWAGFTSVTGVNSLFELLSETGRDIRELDAKIAAIGPATAEALRAHGLAVEYIPEVYDGVHLAEGLSRLGGKVLVFRAKEGSPEIAEAFTKYGIDAKQICVYRTDYVQLIHVPDFTDTIIFTSASTVRGFCLSVSTMRGARAVCIGRQTADEALRHGFTDIVIAEQATMDAVVRACS